MTTRGHDDPFAHRASAHRARRRRRFLIAAVSVVVLAALARKVAAIEIAGPLKRRFNNTLRGLENLPIQLTPA